MEKIFFANLLFLVVFFIVGVKSEENFDCVPDINGNVVLNLHKSDIETFLKEKPENFNCPYAYGTIYGTSLTNLTIADTNSTRLPAKLFEEFPGLYHLYAPEAGLKEIDAEFSKLHSTIILNTLHLNQNNLKTIDYSFLSKCASLRDLDVSENQLEVFYITNTLKVAKADNNKIKNIVVQENSVLETLSLSGNKLNSSVTIELNKIETLKILDLSMNKLNVLNFQSFDNLDLLESLNLSHNQIPAFGFGVLSRQTSLTNLDLSHNHIMNIDLNSFAALSSLKVLDISYNYISSFGMFAETRFHLESLQSIYVEGNFWHCTDLIQMKLNLKTQGIVLEHPRKPVRGHFNFLGIKCIPLGLL